MQLIITVFTIISLFISQSQSAISLEAECDRGETQNNTYKDSRGCTVKETRKCTSSYRWGSWTRIGPPVCPPSQKCSGYKKIDDKSCYVRAGIGTAPAGNICPDPHWTTCAPGYICSITDSGPNKLGDCIPIEQSKKSSTPTIVPTPSPTPSPIAACNSLLVYTNSWALLNAASMVDYKAGDQFYMCALGVGNTGTFTKAQFAVNGTARGEVTFKKPGTEYFCDLYTIPPDTYNFQTSALVYNSDLGWK